jgi:hypothetical protein
MRDVPLVELAALLLFWATVMLLRGAKRHPADGDGNNGGGDEGRRKHERRRRYYSSALDGGPSNSAYGEALPSAERGYGRHARHPDAWAELTKTHVV